MRRLRVSPLLLGFLLSCLVAADLHLSAKLLEAVEKKFGKPARSRLLNWQILVEDHANDDTVAKLNAVNLFFNQQEFVDDILHWKKTDYWATPVEFLATQGGDCEDFSVAKYFTLVALGVPQEQLRITYVKALLINQAHMVLTYYERPNAEPLVLDNLIAEIRPASQRKDLLPVYSFNGAELWLAKADVTAAVGSSDRLAPWRELRLRMDAEQRGVLGI